MVGRVKGYINIGWIMADFTNIMKHKTDYFSKEEIALMLNFCHDKINNSFIGSRWLRNYMLILTLFRTGRRVSEIVGQPPYTKAKGLRPLDFHDDFLIEFDILKKNQVKRKTKKGTIRKPDILKKLRFERIPLRRLKPVDKYYYNLMMEFIENQNIQSHQRIFRITRQRVDIIVKQIAEGCKIARDYSKIHAHQFRHSFSIHFLKGNPRNPMALLQLKDLLEHSSTDVTSIYAQFTQEDKQESVENAFGDEQ